MVNILKTWADLRLRGMDQSDKKLRKVKYLAKQLLLFVQNIVENEHLFHQ